MARAVAVKLLFHSPFPLTNPNSLSINRLLCTTASSTSATAGAAANGSRKSKRKSSTAVSPAIESKSKSKSGSSEAVKRRTRSEKEFNVEYVSGYGGRDSHVPVMLGEVLDVFSCDSSSFRLRSFVDCTIGAAGHSAAMIQSHPELQVYIGLDVDPVAHEKARARINDMLHHHSFHENSELQTHMLVKNFKYIKQVINEVDENLLACGVDGILMDLGMSSMQVDDAGRGFSMLNDGPLDMRMDPRASLRAEDILNSWPAMEVGRILRDYGEESNWFQLQNKIVKARLAGGLHSTVELVDLIRNTTSWTRGGRQGWIKTAARVFQALRIAVNDELQTLETSIRACFDSLSPGGRLAVISFHSLEDRIVKHTFLDLINGDPIDQNLSEERDRYRDESRERKDECFGDERWIKQIVKGRNGVVLTKRPVTACVEEERVNSRCRSAKLRVIQKL